MPSTHDRTRAQRAVALREWLDTLSEFDTQAAGQVQRALDDALGLRLPVGEAREITLGDLMPFERAALGLGFADTEVMQ